MSDMRDFFKDHKKELRAKYGVECPVCKVVHPRVCATILLPQQRCRLDGYIDSRPALTKEQLEAK